MHWKNDGKQNLFGYCPQTFNYSKADWIVVMEKGDIVEQGTHHDLIAKKGVYHKLVELQNFD
jgi:ABC-type transport system involved in cytochrome bd biosynthesis fused ATPase/permease subunit